MKDIFLPKRSIFASTDTLRTEMSAETFFKGMYPFDESIMTNQPLWEVNQLFNPLENTQFESMLKTSGDTCQSKVVQRIPAKDNPTAVFDDQECPFVNKFLNSDAFNQDKVADLLVKDFG